MTALARLSALPLLIALPSAPSAADTIERVAFSGAAVNVTNGADTIRGTVGEAGIVRDAGNGAPRVGGGFWSGHFHRIATAVPDTDQGAATVHFADGLRQNFPNPFRGATTVAYTVGRPSDVDLTIFDVTGRRVATLAQARHDPGLYRVSWEGRDLSGHRVASGIYFYRLKIGSWSATRKLVKLR